METVMWVVYVVGVILGFIILGVYYQWEGLTLENDPEVLEVVAVIFWPLALVLIGSTIIASKLMDLGRFALKYAMERFEQPSE